MTWMTCTLAAGYGGGDGRTRAADAGRRAVARLLQMRDGSALEIASRAGSPPLVRLREAGAARALPVALSVAHTVGAAVAVAAPAGVRVGVDVEPAGSVGDADLRFFLTPREQVLARRVGATTMWCLKEAAWKALGCGTAVPFKRVELLFSGDALTGVRTGGRTWNAHARLRRHRHARRSWIVAAVRIGEERRHA